MTGLALIVIFFTLFVTGIVSVAKIKRALRKAVESERTPVIIKEVQVVSDFIVAESLVGLEAWGESLQARNNYPELSIEERLDRLSAIVNGDSDKK
jgi:hypothetical protein